MCSQRTESGWSNEDTAAAATAIAVLDEIGQIPPGTFENLTRQETSTALALLLATNYPFEHLVTCSVNWGEIASAMFLQSLMDADEQE